MIQGRNLDRESLFYLLRDSNQLRITTTKPADVFIDPVLNTWQCYQEDNDAHLSMAMPLGTCLYNCRVGDHNGVIGVYQSHQLGHMLHAIWSIALNGPAQEICSSSLGFGQITFWDRVPQIQFPVEA